MAWMIGILWMVGMVCKSVGCGMFDMTACMVNGMYDYYDGYGMFAMQGRYGMYGMYGMYVWYCMYGRCG